MNRKLLFQRAFLCVIDIMAILFSSAFALLLRYEFNYQLVEQRFIDCAWTFLPYNIMVTLIIFYIFRLYHSLWEYAGVTEMQNVIIACMLCGGLQLLGLQLLDWHMPRSYYFIYTGTFMILTIASRFVYRYLRLIKRKIRQIKAKQTVMVIGGQSAVVVGDDVELYGNTEDFGESNSNVVGHFGDVDLTFEVLER